MQRELHRLTSIPFLTCLFLLLLNDFILKATFHNQITGKLSDVCGLFIFPIFWTVLFPKRKGLIFILTALIFILWKSPYSQVFITVFSDYVFRIERIVDFTDLFALLVLPLAWFSVSKSRETRYISPWFAGIITLFSFCATSVSRPVIHFEQPQYVLFERDERLSDIIEYGSFKTHPFGNLIVLEVTQLETDERPAKKDDFFKTIIQKDLDTRVVNQIPDFISESLKPARGTHQLIIESNDYKDVLSFSGTRLHGKFSRYRSNGKPLIEGQFKHGIEDSIWTIRDSITNQITKKIFINGELVKVETFDSNRRTSSEKVNTRQDTITGKYFQIAILIIFAISMLILIGRNFKSADKLHISFWHRTILIILLPIVVMIFNILLREAIPDSFSAPFDSAGQSFLIYLIGVPLFLLILGVIKVRKVIDILLYCLLLAFLFNIWLEVLQFGRLTSGLL